ncbi:MAG: hypothetical protein PVH88_20270 [Ignavibacteria bacterium]|jgi:hypothetical protein
MKCSFIILFILFISGSFLAAETGSNSKNNNSDFKEVQVYPLYRLPDKDVTIEWSTPSPDGIKIIYGDKEIIQGPEGKFIIPDSELSLMPESFEIKVIVNSKDGEERKIVVETFDKPRKIKRTIDQEGFTERFVINFPEKEWDNDLVIRKIELDSPKSYYLGNLSVGTEFREVYTKWEYYNKSRKVGGYLLWDNNYKSDRGFPASPKGIWTFRLWNYPWNRPYVDVRPVHLYPDIIFTIGGKEDN